ncbi:MAG TPA: hypothetical protein VM715_00920 [Candidatus Acidoferrum sp.]|nr:hypothetical protein [Candidatus Acidoferrum sp.]
MDESKIVFALSYLRGMALEFFEPHIGLPAEPSFLLNWDDFREVLETNFGPMIRKEKLKPNWMRFG